MLQLEYAYTRHTHRQAARPHMTALGLVALLHAVLGIAIVNAIGGVEVTQPPSIHTTVNPGERPPVTLPPPTPPRIDLPPPLTPTLPTVVVTRPPGPSNAISPEPERLPGPPLAQPAPPEITFSPPRAIASTQTGPTYPPISRRLGEEGSVRLRLTVGTEGRVVAADILESSGSSRLDDAAVRWVQRHWRYEPAMEGERPVQGTVEALLRFELE